MIGYIRFDPTGNDRVDKILNAIESAGNKYHHTSDWSDDSAGGPTELDQIQAAANAAAPVEDPKKDSMSLNEELQKQQKRDQHELARITGRAIGKEIAEALILIAKHDTSSISLGVDKLLRKIDSCQD